jgi:guanylate kinase
MQTARYELTFWDIYEYVVINEEGRSDEAAEKILDIENAERAKTLRNAEIKEKFFD